MCLAMGGVVSVAAQTGGGVWQGLAPMPTARQELCSAVLNGKVYVIAGYDEDVRSTDKVEVYHPATDTWSTAHPIPVKNNHNAAAVAAGKLYCFGGISNSTFLYDPAADSWSNVATMIYGHSNTPAVGVIDDKIYVAGGETARTAMEVFDPATNTWTSRAPMSVGRNHCAGGVLDGKFHVVGGRGNGAAPTAHEAYDPATNSWSTRAPMPTGRSGMAAGVVGGELYVFGGEGDALHGEVEVYNPRTDSWRRLPDMPVPRHGIWAAVIGNRIFLPGGAAEINFAAAAWTDVFTADRQATFGNISSRLKVETGDKVMIGGFIVTGKGSKRVILRATGPSVPVTGALADPTLELYNDAGQLVAMNDNWQDAPNHEEMADSTLAPAHPREAAILTRLAPGNHTAVVRGANGTTGVGLVEVYDLEPGSDAKLGNISTRGFVQTGDNILIGGLILTGSSPLRVLVRALGPSLPVAGALADPTLELRDRDGALLASNDDWRSTQEAEIIGTTLPPPSEREAAIVRTLPPASYTAIVRGVGGSTGVALVEAYTLE